MTQQNPASPDGEMVMVPREPTDDQIERIARQLARIKGHKNADEIIMATDGECPVWHFYRIEARNCYTVALASAPRPDARPEPKLSQCYDTVRAAVRELDLHPDAPPPPPPPPDNLTPRPDAACTHGIEMSAHCVRCNPGAALGIDTRFITGTPDADAKLAEALQECERLRAELADYEEAYQQHQANVRRLDVALSGDDAARAPLLIDVLGQVEDLARKHGPLLRALGAAK